MEPHKIILLVEDNKQDELLTIRALRRHEVRHEVVVCRDGAEAIDWLKARGQHSSRDLTLVPTVVLLDLKLPKVSGLKVLASIRNDITTKRLPVVVLTTSKEESDIAQCYDNGANSYVQKPVNYTEFSDAIKDLGKYWLQMNESPKIGFTGTSQNL